MRLHKNDVDIIKSTISKYVKNAKIILFGSRIDDQKRGGDIDILVQTSENVSLKKQIRILAEIEYKGLSRKLDLLFQTPFSAKQNIFEQAEKEGLVL